MKRKRNKSYWMLRVRRLKGKMLARSIFGRSYGKILWKRARPDALTRLATLTEELGQTL
jgi:hypothetical protein